LIPLEPEEAEEPEEDPEEIESMSSPQRVLQSTQVKFNKYLIGSLRDQ
jgi:hypothetical protein